MADDGVLERHGVSKNPGYVNVQEGHGHITVFVFDGAPGSSAKGREISPAEARYVARKLYRLARRVEKRTEAAK